MWTDPMAQPFQANAELAFRRQVTGSANQRRAIREKKPLIGRFSLAS